MKDFLKNCLAIFVIYAAMIAFMSMMSIAAFGQEIEGPVINIQAPAKVKAGQIVWIKTEGSRFDDIVWKSGAPDHAWSLSEDKRTCMFQSMDAGKFLFIVAVSKNNRVDVACFQIELTGGSEPQPNPPQPGPDNDPSPGSAFSVTIRNLLKQHVPQASLSKHARKLSEQIRNLCNGISTNKDRYNPRTAREAFVKRNRTVIGEDIGSWKFFSDAMAVEVKKEVGDNPTLNDLVRAWNQVADALEKEGMK